MPRKIDITGKRFGRLLVISPATASTGNNPRTRWHCQCDCGEPRIVDTFNLVRGRAKSCGCLQKEIVSARNTIHGHTGSRTYNSWDAMIGRCTNPKQISYPWYGAKGIKVCKRWMKFANFLYDMGERPEGMTLDRLNNSVGYQPNNCKWSTRMEQDLNKRHTGHDSSGSKNGNNKLVESNVETIKMLLNSGKTGGEIAKQFGVTKTTISRIKLNKSWTHVKENKNVY